MTEKPFLEIVMPTRNRLEALQKNIPDIISQISDMDAIISFYDNASSDGTEEYLRELAATSSKVLYRRNEANIGLDRNMLLGVEQSVGKFLFWLGDDDILRPSAIQDIQSILKKYNPHLLLLQMISSPDEWSYETKPQTFYDQPDKFFDDCCYLMPFGTQIFDAEIAKKQIINADRFIGTFHAYSGLLLDALAETYQKLKNISVVSHSMPLVKCTAITKAWASDKAEMYISGLPKWFELLHPMYAELAIIKKMNLLIGRTILIYFKLHQLRNVMGKS
jgi:glycosyltransferase involved in cell wall biosynthesis